MDRSDIVSRFRPRRNLIVEVRGVRQGAGQEEPHRVRAHPLVRRYAVTFGHVPYELRPVDMRKASRRTTPSSRSSPRCNIGEAALRRGRSKRGAALVSRSRFLV